jgi:hypothetical protein
MRMRHALILTAAFALVGCGGSGDKGATTGFAKARGCSTLTESDVAKVTGTKANKLDLAPPPEERARCSTAFFRGGTELVVSITERDGGTPTLNRVRAALAKVEGTPQRATAPGEDAFLINRRILGFRRGDDVVVLETGFSGRRLILTVGQLQRLARLVAQRL